LREEEIPQVVWSMVCNNQTVGSKLGTKEVFQVREKKFPSGQEQVLLAEEPLDGRAVERWMIGDHLDVRVDAYEALLFVVPRVRNWWIVETV
jgi:hypothetical protein